VVRYQADKIDWEAVVEGTTAVQGVVAAGVVATRSPGFRNRNSAVRGCASPAAMAPAQNRTGLLCAEAAAGPVHNDYRVWFSGPAFPHRFPETF